jgi:uncharacterized MAPEG superfamily protein
MTSLAAQPAFVAYVVMLIVLSLNLLLLWAYSGSVRGKTKTTPNKEDASTVSKGAQLVETEPPEVARVLRAYKNAEANIVPFLLLGLVYVLAGASAVAAEVVFGVFTVARLAHSFAYLGGKQPWRSMMYGIGALDTLALIGLLVKAIVAP